MAVRPVTARTGQGRAGRAVDLAVAVAIVGVVVALRMLVAVPDFGGVSPDHGNVWLAVDQVDVGLDRPHPPGAFLHVLAVRGLAALMGDRATAMLALSVAASALGCGLLFLWLHRWMGRTASVLVTALVASNPMAWFYGATTEAYSLDLCFASLAALLASRRRGVLWLPVVFAVAGGLRPFSPFLLLPLYLLAWTQARRDGAVSVRALVAAHLAGVLTALAWCVPLVRSAGGLEAYVQTCLAYGAGYGDPVRNLQGMSLFLLPIALPTLVLLCGRFGQRARSEVPADVPVRLLLAWLALPLLVFTTVLYEKGYFLLVLAPWLLLWIRPLRTEARRRAVLVTAVVLQVAFFLLMPHRWPDAEVSLAARHRTLPSAQVWWQRSQSTHLQAASRLRALASVADDVALLLRDVSPRTVVYADPTVPLVLRALQVRFPDRAFARSEPFVADTYRLHHGAHEATATGLAGLLDDAVVLTRAELADGALRTLLRRGEAAGPLTLVRPLPGKSGDLARRYDDLFLRP